MTGDPNITGSSNIFAAALTTGTADGFLTQSLATTAGQQYTLSFQVEGDGATPNSLTASLGGVSLVALMNLPDTVPNFVTYTASHTATSASSSLSFAFRDDPGFLYLTNISVASNNVAVPEPPAIVGLGMGGLMVAGCLWRAQRGSDARLAI